MHRIEETVARGMCVGCGACSVATRGAIPVTIGRYGVMQARLDGVAESDRRLGSAVCPFSDEAPNETELGVPDRSDSYAPQDPHTGHYLQVLAGRVADDNYLLGSSSGGLTSWLLGELLGRGLVDGVVHVGRAEGDSLFGYRISHTIEQVRDARKSQYYSVTLAEVLATVRDSDKRYAIVGVPCFIKAARSLARTDASLKANLRYYIGLVCGHLKSQFFAESLAWQIGVSPDDLESVDFRIKNPARASVEYDFGALKAGDEQMRSAPTRTLVGGNWGHGAFQPEACNFCDDIFAETADIVFGDAWLPQYEKDWRGTNVVVNRNPELRDIFAEGVAAGAINLDALTLDDAADSQGGNFRHRRQGLAVRLADDLDKGLSVPQKRVEPDLSVVPARRRRLIRQRRVMSGRGTEAFVRAKKQADLRVYLSTMRTEVRRYRRIEGSLIRKIAIRVRKYSGMICRRVARPGGNS